MESPIVVQQTEVHGPCDDATYRNRDSMPEKEAFVFMQTNQTHPAGLVTSHVSLAETSDLQFPSHTYCELNAISGAFTAIRSHDFQHGSSTQPARNLVVINGLNFFG